MKKMVQKIDKNLIVKIVSMIAIIVIFNFIYVLVNNDKSIVNVYYRAKVNNKYTNWSKNGKSINNDKTIEDLNIKLSSTKEGNVLCKLANKKGEFIDIHYTNSKSFDGVYATRIYLSRVLEKKYDICYRTYNQKDKWLDWACNGEISGNKKYKVRNIKIKIIPKNVLKSEYLEEYKKNIKGKSKGFKE